MKKEKLFLFCKQKGHGSSSFIIKELPKIPTIICIDDHKRRFTYCTLTDIRMPGINGLELACEIKARYPNIKTVLLSAYNDFEYARKGIEYGVYGYLLKSEDEEVFEEYFIKMKTKLDKECQVKKEGITVIDAPEESLFNKRNKLMHNLLSNKSNQASDELFEQI